MKNLTFGILTSVAISFVIVASAGDPKWSAANEASLRKLVGSEHVMIELYFAKQNSDSVEISPLLHRLHVPERFVEIY